MLGVCDAQIRGKFEATERNSKDILILLLLTIHEHFNVLM